MGGAARAAYLLRKDLRIELRKKESVAAMTFFGVLVLVILNVAQGPGRQADPETAAGVLWVAVIFSAVLGLGRVFARERENGCISALLASPMAPGSIFVAKALVNLTLMVLSQLVLVPVFFALFGQGLSGGALGLVPSLLLVDAGFSAAGTLLSAVSAGTRRNEVLLPILLFPLVLPLVALAVKATGAALAGRPTPELAGLLEPLAAFVLIYATAGYLLFPSVIREG